MLTIVDFGTDIDESRAMSRVYSIERQLKRLSDGFWAVITREGQKYVEIEQEPSNLLVAGSIPAEGTKTSFELRFVKLT